ncbi:unnamed protein product [Rotaria magnacalcarata]|uniref:Uncharacterized protein n=1 Tax=Rotaria magnacalcarata TaxID=392030 RepID=A0A816PBV7_9BILA|nr:unnamed protein product [Rotaria magnacalcarata]CAF1670421.1 unnamed protein product [Rotaria magnacalcarata]CAF2046749.1 unnamed protein product [Rotaria magnacalcarata]CAF2069693.1 unnamed protein product [Rotaria magnacalcarata]CAF2123846.1 unnamed protein product [Rotaria magnacalcarata]
MPIESALNTVEDSLRIMHTSCEHDSSPIVQQSNEIILILEPKLAKQDTLLKQNQLFNDELEKAKFTRSSEYSLQSNIAQSISTGISLITFLFVSILFGNLGSCLNFYGDKHTPQFSNNMLLPGINYFDWFRTLAVP